MRERERERGGGGVLPRNVARYDGNHGGSYETSAGIFQLLCEVVGHQHSERGEEGSKKHADMSNINRYVHLMHHVVEKGRRHHQTC